MTCEDTLICSRESEDSPSLPTGPDTEPLDSARLMNGASESSDDTGQMSLFGETCERSRWMQSRNYFPTPTGSDGTRDGKAYRKNTNMFEGGSHSVQLAHLAAHGLLTSSPPAIPASHSHSPGSDWARKMTATYGRKLSDYWLSSAPPDSWVRTLLVTSIWGSMTCYLTWKKSATPQGRLLFRLVPSTPRTDGIGSGYWGTQTSRDWKDGSSVANVPENGLLGRQVVNRQWPTPRVEGFDAGAHRGNPDSLHSAVKMWPTPTANEMRTTDREQLIERRERAKERAKNGNGFGLTLGNAMTMDGAAPGMKLNSAWVQRMMGYPDDWLTLDGEVTR